MQRTVVCGFSWHLRPDGLVVCSEEKAVAAVCVWWREGWSLVFGLQGSAHWCCFRSLCVYMCVGLEERVVWGGARKKGFWGWGLIFGGKRRIVSLCVSFLGVRSRVL